jgi:hypothetical protein
MEVGREGLRRGSPQATFGPLVATRLDGGARDALRPHERGHDRAPGRRDPRRQAYLVRFSAARATFARRVAALDALLRSWRWAK